MRLRLAMFATLLVVLSSIVSASGAFAASSQEAWLQDDGALLRDPAGTLHRMRLLGVDRARLAVRWLTIAPKPSSRQRPGGFNASDPAAYPRGAWGSLDALVRNAHRDGIGLNFNVVGGAPLWATAPGAPRDKPHPNWEPSAKEYGAFVRALATRYSGNYDPASRRTKPGNPNDLPAVNFWSVWNEPDYGPSLAPQGLPGNLTIEHSPAIYRGLLDAAWGALRSTGHGHDTILFGEVAPRGLPTWGVFSGMKPLVFLRALYCVDGHYRKLHGTAARLRGCPTNAAGSRAFRGAHPALFQATGFADHPYSRWHPPNVERPNDRDYTSLADIGNLTRSLDRLQHVYGSSKVFPVWNTEYGYITSPPKRSTKRIPYISPATAAQFLNQAEYISWRNPRIRSFMQYLLSDPLPPGAANDYGGFASGLLTYGGQPKVTYSAWRLPIWMPSTRTRSGQSLEVWGAVRPTFFTRMDVPGAPQSVQVQFQPSSGGPFTTVKTVPVTDEHGYFDTRVAFSGSGAVRLAWTYPPDDPLLAPGYTAFSRHVALTTH